MILEKKFVFLFYMYLLFYPTLPYSVASSDVFDGIRGYSFGERLSFVLQKETEKNELFLTTTLPESNQLTYQGTLFNKKVILTYLFRQQRLTSILYTWKLPDKNGIFLSYLQNLLTKKYGKGLKKIFPLLDDSIEIYSYNIQKNTKKTTAPSLFIELEKFIQSSSYGTDEAALNIYILEFRPFDPDFIIQSKIFSEDI